MVAHDWFDKDFDFEELYKAEHWIAKQVKRLSGCYLLSKEKYGTIRYEHIVPPKGSPYYLRGRINIGKYMWCWNTCWLYRKWEQFGWFVTKHVVFRAVKKWPHLKDELLEDLAGNEELVGKELHDQYWAVLKSDYNILTKQLPKKR